MMANLVFQVGVFCAVLTVGLAGSVTTNLISAPSCKEMNSITDKVISSVNSQNKARIQDFVVSDQIIKPSFFGFEVYLKSQEPGSLKSSATNFDSLSRSGDASNCSSPIFSTLDGQFTIGPVVWNFPHTTFKFLFLEDGGSLVQTADILVEIVVGQGSECRLEALKVVGIKNLKYQFVTGTWKGWIVEKILTHAILSLDTNSLVQLASEAITRSIVTEFSTMWCQAVRSP